MHKKSNTNNIEDGFSSQEEIENQAMLMQEFKQEDFSLHTINQKKDHLKYLTPPEEIKQKKYSLEPDIVTGWSPKIFLAKPIPLMFGNENLDEILQFLIKVTRNEPLFLLCYLGPRFENTYCAWKHLLSENHFPYHHLNLPKKQLLTTRKFHGQNWEAERQDCLNFDSLFQSGNLDCVFKVAQFQYDLFMRVDANTRGHLQWYNFKVKNIKKQQCYKFNICNFQKAKSLYTRGMKPFIYSKKQWQLNGKSWIQSGENITYERKMPKIMKIYNIDPENICCWFKLSFTFKTVYEDDEVQICYCIPYTYTKLMKLIDDLEADNSNRDCLTVEKLCYSLSGLQVPLLTITSDASDEQKAFQNKLTHHNKKILLATSRIHPGEANGSIMMEGFIKYLLSVEAQQLREMFVFKIIPMMNPDGVVLGHYRTGLSGRDFNREFIKPDPIQFVEVYQLKSYISKCRHIYRDAFVMYLDFHGHSLKKNVFTYGPQFPITNQKYYQCRIFPKLLSNTTKMFRYYSCSFKITAGKEATGRAILIKNYGVNLTYTIEASNGSFYDQDKLIDIYFNEELWNQMGKSVGEVINCYYKMLAQIQINKIKKKKQKQKMLAKNKNQKLRRIHSSITRNSNLTPSNKKYNIFEEQKQRSMLLDGNNDKNANKRLMNIFDEIRNEEVKLQMCEDEERCSDDEISEGKSDSDGSENDLEQEELNFIMQNFIKNKKKLSFNKKEFRRQERTKYPKIISTSAFITDQDQDNELKSSQPINSPIKENIKKIFLRRKKTHTNWTPSPVKQQAEKNCIAKIVNFSFAITPIPCLQIKSETRISNSNINHQDEKMKKLKTEVYDAEYEKIIEKVMDKGQEFSESFRKTFMSVQKDLARREIQRKSYANSFYSPVKTPSRVEEIIGRKIFHEFNK